MIANSICKVLIEFGWVMDGLAGAETGDQKPSGLGQRPDKTEEICLGAKPMCHCAMPHMHVEVQYIGLCRAANSPPDRMLCMHVQYHVALLRTDGQTLDGRRSDCETRSSANGDIQDFGDLICMVLQQLHARNVNARCNQS